jgi:hypothetical protein
MGAGEILITVALDLHQMTPQEGIGRSASALSINSNKELSIY